MTTEAIKLKLEPRHLLGKKVKRLRRAGMVPIHLYGPGVESRSLQCQTQKLIQVLSIAGGNTPISVSIEGEPGNQLAFAREIQWDPRRDTVVHVDLLAADLSRPVTAQVPVTLIGQAPGAVRSGGYVSQQLFDLQVSALPMEMPGQIEVDLDAMTEANSDIRAGGIVLPASVSLLTDPEDIVARVEVPRVGVGDELDEAGRGTSAAGSEEESR
jgi:large subunit ribosomal protein L25